MIARRLSRFFALALITLTFWSVASGPGVVDPEFVKEGYAVVALLVAVLFGLLFLALRVATAGSTIYWSGSLHQNQLGWIFTMIGVAIAVHLTASWIFELQGRLIETATIVSTLNWTLIPAAFLALGLVKWPTRLKCTSKLRLSLVGAAAVGFAIAVSYAKFAEGPTEFEMPSAGVLLISVANIIVAAAAEEVVFRVLLLTALLDLIKSRFNAVFLSGVVFGLVHAPFALIEPVMHGDWLLLKYAAQAYAPDFLSQTFAGMIFGVLWLRTGSIGLVVLVHAVMNVGPTMLTGLY